MDTLYGDLRLQDSFYEPFKSEKTVITYEPYKKYKIIEIDTPTCRIINEKDYFVRPISQKLYESIRINKFYNNKVRLDSFNIEYQIKLLDPTINVSGFGFKEPPLRKGEKPKWWLYNKDSLFTDKHWENDLIFFRKISKNRGYSLSITENEADSLLTAWGLGKYRGDIPKKEP